MAWVGAPPKPEGSKVQIFPGNTILEDSAGEAMAGTEAGKESLAMGGSQGAEIKIIKHYPVLSGSGAEKTWRGVMARMLHQSLAKSVAGEKWLKIFSEGTPSEPLDGQSQIRDGAQLAAEIIEVVKAKVQKLGLSMTGRGRTRTGSGGV